MTESPQTRATLLLRLRDRNDSLAWGQFIQLYGPMLYRFVRSRGLQDADAADLVQEVMRSVGMSIGRLEYEKSRGGFRPWLFSITRNKLSTHFQKKRQLIPTGKDSDQFARMEAASASDSELESQWENEYQRRLAAMAIDELKPTIDEKTWAAFELTAMKGLSAEQASEQLGMSKGAVYVARSRVTAKLRLEIERLLAIEDE